MFWLKSLFTTSRGSQLVELCIVFSLIGVVVIRFISSPEGRRLVELKESEIANDFAKLTAHPPAVVRSSVNGGYLIEASCFTGYGKKVAPILNNFPDGLRCFAATRLFVPNGQAKSFTNIDYDDKSVADTDPFSFCASDPNPLPVNTWCTNKMKELFLKTDLDLRDKHYGCIYPYIGLATAQNSRVVPLASCSLLPLY